MFPRRSVNSCPGSGPQAGLAPASLRVMLPSHEIAGTIILRTTRGTGTWPARVPPTPRRLVVMVVLTVVLTVLALPSRFRAWVPAAEAAPPAARVLDMGEIRGAMRKTR